MQILLILLIVGAIGMTAFALVRGLVYFARTSDALTNGTGPSEHLLAQNRMMFSRIKWQAIAILLLVAIGVLAAN